MSKNSSNKVKDNPAPLSADSIFAEIEGEVGTQTVIKGFEELDKTLRSINQRVPSTNDVLMPAPISKNISTGNSMQQLFRGIHLVQEDTPEVATATGTKKPTAKAACLNIHNKNITFSKGIGEFELAVLEAAISQLNGNERGFTTEMLCRTMTGKSDTKGSAGDNLYEATENAMSRLMYSPFLVQGGTENSNVFLDGTILPVTRLRQTVGGAVVSTFRFTGVPLLLRMLEQCGAITYFPTSMSHIPAINSTLRSISVINALQRIVCPLIFAPDGSQMKEERECGYTPAPVVIKFSYLYDIAWQSDKRTPLEEGKEYPWSLTDGVRKNVGFILDEWKGKGFIADWERIREGKSLVGVRVKFFPVKKEYLPLRTQTEFPIESTYNTLVNPTKLNG